MPLASFGLKNVHKQRIADRQWGSLFAFREKLARGNNAFGFHADVNQDLVWIDTHDCTLNGFTSTQTAKGVIVVTEQSFHARLIVSASHAVAGRYERLCLGGSGAVLLKVGWLQSPV